MDISLTDLDARLRVVEQKLGISSITPTDDRILVSDPKQITAPGRYRLTPGSYSTSTGYTLPNGTSLDATGSSFSCSADWMGVWGLSNHEDVEIIGGSYTVGTNASIGYLIGCANVSIRNVVLMPGSGNAFRVVGGSNITLDGLTATTWVSYCLFADTGVKNLTVQNWKVDGGSKNESCIRVYAHGFVLKDSHLFCDLNTAGARKNVFARLHDGENYVISNVEARGNLGIGPMAGGDGGQQWGTSQWIGSDGTWYVPPEKADKTKTLAKRAADLSLRTTHVRISGLNIIEGKVQPNCGLVDCVWDGGSITNSTQPMQPGWPAANYCYYGMANQYPDGSQFSQLLPGDVPRPKADITINNVALHGSAFEQPNIVKIGVGNTINGAVLK